MKTKKPQIDYGFYQNTIYPYKQYTEKHEFIIWRKRIKQTKKILINEEIEIFFIQLIFRNETYERFGQGKVRTINDFEESI